VTRIKDLQVRLKLVGQFPYAITGIYWSAVDRSVLAFQHAKGLAETGVVDQPTWDLLRTLTNTPVVLPRTSSTLRVKDLQVRLKLNGRFAYAITGVYWSAVDRSVLTFQILYNLPQTGVVDQRTWDRLKALTASPVVIGRTAGAAQLKEVQLRLRALGTWAYGITGVYWSALDRAVLSFQQQRNLPQSGVIDQRTWSRLVSLTYTPGTFDQHRYNAGLRPVVPTAASLDSRCRTGRVMCVDKATRTLTWVVDGKPLMVMWARFGRPGLETREGTFRVSRKYEYVISNLYFTPMPYSMFFSGGQAVHYSSNFARLGYASASHGCVNIADHAQIKSLFFKVRVGDKVVVYH
jgi:peptidoglycan hydrolase-like protein with peptidoglycan-binding domain